MRGSTRCKRIWKGSRVWIRSRTKTTRWCSTKSVWRCCNYCYRLDNTQPIGERATLLSWTLLKLPPFRAWRENGETGGKTEKIQQFYEDEIPMDVGPFCPNANVRFSSSSKPPLWKPCEVIESLTDPNPNPAAFGSIVPRLSCFLSVFGVTSLDFHGMLPKASAISNAASNEEPRHCCFTDCLILVSR